MCSNINLEPQRTSTSKRVFISYRHIKPDEDLAHHLRDCFKPRGHEVFIDTQMLVGTKWVEEIDQQIRAAEFFIVLLSAGSICSDMVRQEVKLAHELEQQGKLKILPVRVAFQGELPYDLGAYLNGIQYTFWREGIDHESIAAQFLAAIEQSVNLPYAGRVGSESEAVQALFQATEAVGAPLPYADPRLLVHLEPETGALVCDSPFYVRRQTDSLMEQQAQKSGVTVRIKAPRQMGKSSLLARALALAQQQQHKTLYFDFELFDTTQLGNLDNLLCYLARRLARNFRTALKPDNFWDPNLGSKDNLTDFIELGILAEAEAPVVLLFDEADRVFNRPYRDDFFATLRGWHNLRATKPQWRRLNLFIAHSTEPYLWIQDLNQSPFNVGFPIQLKVFTPDQIADLNIRHGSPLRTQKEIQQLHSLVGGQPYLVRQALYALTFNRWSMAQLQAAALADYGPFGDHLRNFVWRLQGHKDLQNALQQALHQSSCNDELHFQRLMAAGLVQGESRHAVQLRCQLYEQYFRQHL